MRKKGQRNAIQKVRTPAKNPTSRVPIAAGVPMCVMSALIAPAVAKITHHPIGIAASAISSPDHSRKAPCSSGIG